MSCRDNLSTGGGKTTRMHAALVAPECQSQMQLSKKTRTPKMLVDSPPLFFPIFFFLILFLHSAMSVLPFFNYRSFIIFSRGRFCQLHRPAKLSMKGIGGLPGHPLLLSSVQLIQPKSRSGGEHGRCKNAGENCLSPRQLLKAALRYLLLHLAIFFLG